MPLMNGDLWDIWQTNVMVRLLGYSCLALLVALTLRQLAHRAFRRLKKRHPTLTPLISQTSRPMRWLSPMLAFAITLNAVPSLSEISWMPALQKTLLFAVIGAFTWLTVGIIAGLEGMAFQSRSLEQDRSPRSRRVLTQVRVLCRISMVVVTIIGLAGILMTVPAVRQFGASLLASAGLAGLAVGFAARPVLGNVIAGIQIALTQPISLDDCIMVEGQLGFVEEITSTYVVIRTWDERRLVVPLSYFIENPISNWTRTDTNLIGAIFMWFDFSVPLAELRQEFERLLSIDPQWNGREKLFQVSDCNEHALQIRVLISADGMPAWWDTSCRIREGLLTFIAEHYPESLPTARTRLQSDHRTPFSITPPVPSEQWPSSTPTPRPVT